MSLGSQLLCRIGLIGNIIGPRYLTNRKVASGHIYTYIVCDKYTRQCKYAATKYPKCTDRFTDYPLAADRRAPLGRETIRQDNISVNFETSLITGDNFQIVSRFSIESPRLLHTRCKDTMRDCDKVTDIKYCFADAHITYSQERRYFWFCKSLALYGYFYTDAKTPGTPCSGPSGWRRGDYIKRKICWNQVRVCTIFPSCLNME